MLEAGQAGKAGKGAVAVLRPEMVPMVPMVRWSGDPRENFQRDSSLGLSTQISDELHEPNQLQEF